MKYKVVSVALTVQLIDSSWGVIQLSVASVPVPCDICISCLGNLPQLLAASTSITCRVCLYHMLDLNQLLARSPSVICRVCFDHFHIPSQPLGVSASLTCRICHNHLLGPSQSFAGSMLCCTFAVSNLQCCLGIVLLHNQPISIIVSQHISTLTSFSLTM